METEIRMMTKKRADEQAIKVFTENSTRFMLHRRPVRRMCLPSTQVLTGCKVVCLDRQGKLLQTDTIHPHSSQKEKLWRLGKGGGTLSEISCEAIAIGNGRRSRDETFYSKPQPLQEISLVVVNESGASVSASEVAR
jgi:uncharacterized protein